MEPRIALAIKAPIKKAAMPLGGIGIGSIMLHSSGTMIDWRIFGNIATTAENLPGTFFAIRTEVEQKITIRTLQTKAVGGFEPVKEIEFIADEYGTGLSEELSLAGWTVDREVPFSTSAYRIAGRRAELSEFDFELTARRLAGFYIWRVVVPLLLIIFMSWTVFYIDPNELESQITISVTSILTVIALQFTFVGILPKVSYLTRLDKFIQGATILIFLALIESITTSALTLGGKHALARRFDNWSRIIFPITLILFVIFSFCL